MNPLDLQLHSLLGDKTLSFGVHLYHPLEGDMCLINSGVNEYAENAVRRYFNALFFNDSKIGGMEYDIDDYKIIGHEPTIADLHKWLNSMKGEFVHWSQVDGDLWVQKWIRNDRVVNLHIKYDSSKSLLSQSDETKQAIIDFVTSNS